MQVGGAALVGAVVIVARFLEDAVHLFQIFFLLPSEPDHLEKTSLHLAYEACEFLHGSRSDGRGLGVQVADYYSRLSLEGARDYGPSFTAPRLQLAPIGPH